MTKPTLQWEINGDSMTAWADDLVMYEISPDVDSPVWFPHQLTLNHIAEARSEHLGWFHRLSGAQRAAQAHEDYTLRFTPGGLGPLAP